MAQKFFDQGTELAESPAPLEHGHQESGHPGLRPSLIKVPVTPGIGLGEYNSGSTTGEPSYFAHDIANVRESMAQSPSDAASGAKSHHDILRRMSLSSPRLQRKDSVADVDPRAANPSLSLSGGVISATFCIPHSLQLRTGADWVSNSGRALQDSADHDLGNEHSPRNFRSIRLLQIPLLRQGSMESYIGWLDWGNNRS
jgi:trehalose 6-phosphate synthase/phosphatase